MRFAVEESGGGSRGEGAAPRWRSGAPPKDATGWALAALAVGGLLVAGSCGVVLALREALLDLKLDGYLAGAAFVLLVPAVACPILPAIRSLQLAHRARHALAGGDLIGARAAAAAARNFGWLALGVDGAQAVVLSMIWFVVANHLAVGRTFFLLPLMRSSFVPVLQAFWTNVYVFTVAEVLVLVWGLAVAVARLAPGAAGRPIRILATIYVDGFRGLPVIVNIYLIGFGISLTGLPVVKDFSPETFAIVALTLTSGAYVAEVYRAGIESVHGSQTAAARSLGLTYPQTLRFVVVPQAVRRIMPPLLNNFIALQKDTALIGIIGALDAFSQAKSIAISQFNLSAVTTVAILFLVIAIPQARLVDKLMELDQRRIHGEGT